MGAKQTYQNSANRAYLVVALEVLHSGPLQLNHCSVNEKQVVLQTFH
jgi:hypothetical protein